MLDVLLRGEVDAEAMAALARGRPRKKHAQAALGGSNGAYQRQLGSYPRHRDFLEGEVALLDAVIARRMQPWPGGAGHRCQHDGSVGRRAAKVWANRFLASATGN